MAEATVREAGSGDVPVLSALQIEFWRTAFADLLPPAVLASLAQDPRAHQLSWQEKVAGGDVVLLAFEGAEPVGFAAARLDPDESDSGEIELLGVLPRWGRRGHGGRLLAVAARHLTERGAVRGFWWIPARDIASAAFIAAAGWTADGATRALDADGRPLVEVRHGGGLTFMLF